MIAAAPSEADAARPLRLGAWERLLARLQECDNAFCAIWVAELDRPLDPTMVAEAFEDLAPAFPTYFARAVLEPWGQLTAVQLRPSDASGALLHLPRLEGDGAAALRLLADRPLRPSEDGLFRGLIVDAPVPVLALQFSHVAGDGYSHGCLRDALIARLALGEAGRLARPAKIPGAHYVPTDRLKDLLSADPRALGPIARRHGARFRGPPRLAIPPSAGPAELRCFHAEVESSGFASVAAQAARDGITPLFRIAAAFAVAVAGLIEPWAERENDFLALAVPRDFRHHLGLTDHVGNLTYPQGIPIFAADLDEAALPRLLFERMRDGAWSRWPYRPFLAQLEDGAALPVRPEGGFEPFAAFGVTEMSGRGEPDVVAGARVMRRLSATPMLTRRFVRGRVHLSCTIRWHPARDGVLRAIFSRLLDGLGLETVEWTLL